MRVFLISLAIVILDQATKIVVKEFMFLGQSIEVFGSTFQLTFIENPGMAFGIRIGQEGSLIGRWFFATVSVVASGFLIYYIYRVRHERLLYRISLGLILGGAVGNLIDRVFYGRVVDFFDFDFPDVFGLSRWPIFNIADSSVVIGMIMMSLFVFFAGRRSQSADQTENLPDSAGETVSDPNNPAARIDPVSDPMK